MAMAWPAARALIAAATSSQGPALREEITTLAPWAAICSAMALPMPREEPVITATLPVRSNSVPARVAGLSITSLMGRAPLKHPFDFRPFASRAPSPSRWGEVKRT